MVKQRLNTSLAVLLLVMLPADLYLIFRVAPTERIMGEVQRIFYLHVPLAMAAYLAFFAVFIAAILFLRSNNPVWDAAAASAAEVGVLAATLVIVTGSLWARPIWNTWWTWDPRLMTMVLLWFIYAGYFLVRGGIAERQKRSRYSAVIGIVGFLDVPIVSLSTRWWRSIHPRLQGPGGGLDPVMLKVLLFSTLTILLLAIYLFFFRFSVALLEIRATRLMHTLEEES